MVSLNSDIKWGDIMSLYKSNLYQIIDLLFSINRFILLEYYNTLYYKDCVNELIICYFKLNKPIDISFIKEYDKDEMQIFIDEQLKNIFDSLNVE